MLKTSKKPWPFFMYTSLMDAAAGQQSEPEMGAREACLTELLRPCGVEAGHVLAT